MAIARTTHPNQYDVAVSGGGTVFVVHPLSSAAVAWADEHVSEDTTWLGGGFAVEHRYIEDLVAGMRADGLEVR